MGIAIHTWAIHCVLFVYAFFHSQGFPKFALQFVFSILQINGKSGKVPGHETTFGLLGAYLKEKKRRV